MRFRFADSRHRLRVDSRHPHYRAWPDHMSIPPRHAGPPIFRAPLAPIQSACLAANEDTIPWPVSVRHTPAPIRRPFRRFATERTLVTSGLGPGAHSGLLFHHAAIPSVSFRFPGRRVRAFAPRCGKTGSWGLSQS